MNYRVYNIDKEFFCWQCDTLEGKDERQGECVEEKRFKLYTLSEKTEYFCFYEKMINISIVKHSNDKSDILKERLNKARA